MENKVYQQFSLNILQEAAHSFGVNAGTAVLISDIENFVYACDREKEPIILRITHSSHRDAHALQGELDWMAYLSKGGVSVPAPIRSIHGNLIEEVGREDAQFTATAFHKVPGQTIQDAGECTPETYRQWGSVLGRMHRLAKDYQPTNISCRRADWFENDILANAEKYIPGQPIVLGKLQHVVDDLQALPRDRDSFGLAHTDFTDVNFFVHNHRITIFDFDDSEYHWYIFDIAVILFEKLVWLPHLGLD